jgi:hypothetical protein
MKGSELQFFRHGNGSFVPICPRTIEYAKNGL